MSTVTATASDAVLISPTQLLALQAAEPVVLIDTRDADTYALGHIPGAVNLRETFTYLATSTPQGLQELKDTFAAHLGAIGLTVRRRRCSMKTRSTAATASRAGATTC